MKPKISRAHFQSILEKFDKCGSTLKYKKYISTLRKIFESSFTLPTLDACDYSLGEKESKRDQLIKELASLRNGVPSSINKTLCESYNKSECETDKFISEVFNIKERSINLDVSINTSDILKESEGLTGDIPEIIARLERVQLLVKDKICGRVETEEDKILSILNE